MKHEQTINHPFHRAHELSLISSNPANPFMCDACGQPVNDFSYGCGVCNNIHLHMLCALKPLSVSHQSHNHNLALSFSPPYPSKSFTCDICQRMGPNQWLYRCAACEFDAHLSCVTVTTTVPPIQTASSRSPPPPPLTGINQSHNNPPISMQQQPHTRPQQPALHAQFPAGQNQSHHPEVYGPVRPAATATTLIGQGNLWQHAFGSVVNGASQQLGSSLAQGFLGVVSHGHGGYGGHVGHGGYGGHVGHGGGTWAEGSSSLSYDYDTGRDGGGDLDLDGGGGGGGGGTWDGDSSLVSYDYDMGIDGDGCDDDY